MSFCGYNRLGICFLLVVAMWLVLWKSYVDCSEKVPEWPAEVVYRRPYGKGLWVGAGPVLVAQPSLDGRLWGAVSCLHLIACPGLDEWCEFGVLHGIMGIVGWSLAVFA